MPRERNISEIENVVGRLEVPSGGDFTVEVWLVRDNPLWEVTLAGRTAEGKRYSKAIGSNQSHLSVNVEDTPDGRYLLLITATLQEPGGRFTMRAKSEIDEEARDLVPISSKAERIDVLPVLVGGGESVE